MKQILITGASTGLGYALTNAFLNQGDTVDVIGLHTPNIKHKNVHFIPCNLSKLDNILSTLTPKLATKHYDLVVLNAGILGEIQTLQHTPLQEIQTVMNLNVWANKLLIDILTKHTLTKQVVAISSGAAVNGSKGWGAYSLSKSSLNMLLNVYSKEHPNIHFTALAPGIIATPMTKPIIEEVDDELFPSAKKLKESYIQTPHEAATNLLHTFPKLLSYESGSFLDVRTM